MEESNKTQKHSMANVTKDENTPFIPEKETVFFKPALEEKKPKEGKIEHLPTQYDMWRIVFLIFVLHGLGTLMPWNMFINAKSYFVDFKLNTTVESDMKYSMNFLPYLGFAAQVPNVIFNWLNIFMNMGGDLTKRIVWSISCEIVIFVITIVMAMIDTSEWVGTFFWFTMISVIILNMASGIYQNTVYGMVAALPIKYTGAVVLGSNISGLFTALMNIASDVIFESNRTAAIYYFITAMFVLLLCFDTYFALPLNKFYRSQTQVKNKTESSESTQLSIKEYWFVFKSALPQLLNIFLIFVVTLTIFPAIYSDIKPKSNNFFLPDKYFTSITCFLTFNLFAMLGSLTTSWIQWPSKTHLWIPVIARIPFVPLFLFCNYNPAKLTRKMPVYIENEWIYWFSGAVMSYSSGYLSSLGMMYAPQCVQGNYQITAGMFAAATLITGIFFGILISGFMPLIVTL